MTTAIEATEPEKQKGWLAYVFSPQVLLGGVLAWAASTGWDYFKETRSETAKALAEVRTSMGPHIIPQPATIDATTKSIEALKRLSELHENERAKGLVNTQIAHLYWVRDDLRRAEQQEREANEKRRVSEEQAQKVEQAKKALAEAEAKAQAESAAELRRQEAVAVAAKQAADASAQRALADRIEARLAQRAFDRAPK
jgi:hypothetical protein